MIEVATKAQEAYAVLQRANKMSPFDWMTEDAIKEEIREVGSALAKSIREVVRVCSIVHKVAMWDYRNFIVLLGSNRSCKQSHEPEIGKKNMSRRYWDNHVTNSVG